MGKKKAAIVLGALAVAAAAAAGVWYYTQNMAKDSDDRVYVEKVSSIMGTATGALNRYSGVVQPQKTVEVDTDSDRTVKEIYVKVGDAVEEGTSLFIYDTEELEMELEQAKLELENKDVEISGFKNQISELEKEKKDASENSKFEYTTQIQTIQTQIKQAEFEKSSKELEIEKIQKKIDSSEVKSTVAGVVKSLNDSNSQDMGDASSSFMTILSTGNYRIKAVANEQNVNMITSGSDVIVRSRVNEDIVWHGTISNIDTGDASSDSEDDGMVASDDSDSGMTSSSSYPFYVALEDAEGLMLGQHVLVELDEGQEEQKEGLWLFAGYIVQEDEVSFVWADDGNGKLMKKLIELGEYDEQLDEYQIKSGLTADDLIAWPMDGLYEGVITVTDMDEIDYSSDLYNQDGTEELWEDSEYMWDDTEYMYEDESIYDGETYGTEAAYPADEQMIEEAIDGSGAAEDAEVSE